MTSQSTPVIQSILSKVDAFSGLDDSLLAWLTTKAKPYHCEAGQLIFTPDRLPDTFYCIVEGKGRLLYQDSTVNRPITLANALPGDLIGWVGLARQYPCEWITASTHLRLIGFSADVFYELEQQSESFRNWLDSSNSPSELISVLGTSLDSRPSGDYSARDILRVLVSKMMLIPARSPSNIKLDDNKIYLWNVIPPSLDVKAGSFVDPKLLSSLPDGPALRIFSIDKHSWDSAMSLDTETLPDESLQNSLDFWEQNRYSSLIDQDPKGSSYTSQSDSNSSSLFVWKGKRIPFVSGITTVEQTLACLDMLCKFYNSPFRRDVVERAAQQNIKSSSVSLEIIGNLSTFMGFVGTISNIPSAQCFRIQFPSIVIYQDQPCVVFDISGDIVRASIPSQGRVSIPLETFLDDQPGLRVLSLSPGRDTQQKKLNFSWFFPQIRKYRKSLIEVLMASLLLQLLNLAQPLVMQQIFDKVIVQQNLDTLYTLGFVLLGVSLFQGLIGAVRTYLFADTTNRIDIALGSQVIHHLLKLPLRYFDRRPVGELQTRLAELGNIRGFLTGSLLTLALDSLFSVIYIAVMLIYSGTLTAVTLGVIPLFLGITLVASPVIRGQLRKAAERNAQTQSYLVESLNGVQTIKAQNAENNVRWQWQKRYSSFMSENFKTLMIGVSAGTVGGFLSQLTGLLTLWVGAYLVIQGDLTVGQLIAFRIISGYVVGPLLNLATSWQSFQGVALSIERLSDVVDTSTEAGDKDSELPPLPPITGTVTFQDVDFSFLENSKPVVDHVSFTVPSSSFVGIVGRSGSGKSSIMKLLPRLYEPTSGRILIDGYDISKLQLGSVRRQIGIVPQDSLLFEGSIRDNISLISPDATFEDIVSAAKVACAHDFIMEQPDGYASRVGERGSGLSGGQRQRIAIARAVLQNPSMLILDEATSALDYLTERQVCLNLKKHFSSSTVFFITHRLSTIKSSDIILLMESGRLVEQGTHQELLDLKSRYFALYSQQESDLD